MSNAATTAPINPREQRTIREHPVLHLRGPLLVGPQQEIDEAWVVGGRLHHQRPELPAGTELLEIDGFVVPGDRKSTRLNSSHVAISYAVFCLNKKNTMHNRTTLHSNLTSN